MVIYESPWRRKWQPTPVFLPGESHRQRNLEGYSPWGCKESDTTERVHYEVHLVKAMAFPVVMYGCESWSIKKAEHRRIDAFELWVLEKTLESPLDYKEIQPVNLKGDQS